MILKILKVMHCNMKKIHKFYLKMMEKIFIKKTVLKVLILRIFRMFYLNLPCKD